MDPTALAESNDKNKEDKGNKKMDREERLQMLDEEIENLEGQIFSLPRDFAAKYAEHKRTLPKDFAEKYDEHKKSLALWHTLNKERIDKHQVLKMNWLCIQATNDREIISMYWEFHVKKRKFSKERAILLEEKRVNTIVQYFKDEGVPYYTVDDEKAECLVCSESMVKDSRFPLPMPCCGKEVCFDCQKKWAVASIVINTNAQLRSFITTGEVEQPKIPTCPYCKADFLSDEREQEQCVLVKAEEGKAWAQLWLSKFLVKQGEVERSRQWLEIASNQGSAEAQYLLAMEMRKENNYETNDETLNLFRAAATGGYSFAQCAVGNDLMKRGNYEEGIRWLTFCAEQGRPIMTARFGLGLLYEKGEYEKGECGLGVSEELAIYWYKRVIEQEEDPEVCFRPPAAEVRQAEFRVAMSLMQLSIKENVDDMVMPEVMFWLRRSASKDYDPAIQAEKRHLDILSEECHFCSKVPSEGEKLRCCTRCNFSRYCGRECQIGHWKTGHKHVCYDPAVTALPKQGNIFVSPSKKMSPV